MMGAKWLDCPSCGGVGYIERQELHVDTTCPTCRGTGQVERKKVNPLMAGGWAWGSN